MKGFEMANAEDLDEVVAASQRSVLGAMQDVIDSLERETKNPGLTWSQIRFLIDGFKNKKATVIIQKDAQ